MSDQIWQAWRPEDLLQDAYSPDLELRTAVAASDPASEATLQMELSRLRQQAEQKGFSQGQTRGVEEGKKLGYEQGLQQGREEGLAQGIAEHALHQREQTEHIVQLIDNVKLALDNLESVMPSRLVQVALMAARSMLGENVVNANTNAWLMTRIQQLLREESLMKGKAKLWISPEECSSIQEQLGSALAARGWELCIDEKLLPGGCRITTDEGDLDATTETRWNTLCHLSREDYC